MKVAILGAAGITGPWVVTEMEKHYDLILSDVKPMPTPPRHPFRVADVSNPDQVFAACEGADAVVNLSVLRQGFDPCFDINVKGVYNMLRAALKFGIRRVVQTGPTPQWGGYAGDYRDDVGVTEDCPARPGTSPYILTKFLAEETCRVFAAQHDLRVVCIRLVGVHTSRTLPPESLPEVGAHLEDIARAIRLAVEVRDLPSSFEIFQIYCDNPTGRCPIDKAKRLLGYQPQINFTEAWQRPRA